MQVNLNTVNYSMPAQIEASLQSKHLDQTVTVTKREYYRDTWEDEIIYTLSNGIVLWDRAYNGNPFFKGDTIQLHFENDGKILVINGCHEFGHMGGSGYQRK